MMRLAILVVALFAGLQSTVAVTTHVVGDTRGWVVPAEGPIFYVAWSARQTFILGDILYFNFTTGAEDVARVTAEAFLTCNSTNPISLVKTGPANFSLNSTGEYYFIGTLDRHCLQGQKLAINVTTSPGPTPSPTSRTVPENYTVGDRMGWIVPPLGEIAYITWAYDKTFIVGDSLVFNFFNGSDDVAVVTKDVYNSCNTSTSLAVYNNSPAAITLKTTGEHYFTSTYNYHCEFGQKLAINVTGSSTGSPPSTPGSPSSGAAAGPNAALPPVSAAPSRIPTSYLLILFPIAMAVF
ncbi:blue copper protein-like [Corylus avellana]|uniref:blue copper protein-like n=1 Tax=Corylus avellana TaxID=13451 RepID=UPI001E2011B8|nr:blue copper protein-like [Corylus avellana]